MHVQGPRGASLRKGFEPLELCMHSLASQADQPRRRGEQALVINIVT
jgi:hypothetical protein